jgi:hypothetical protein
VWVRSRAPAPGIAWRAPDGVIVIANYVRPGLAEPVSHSGPVSLIIAILAIALLAGVILLVSAPLRTARRRADLPSAELVELEAAREAKYAEIRDAELDYRTGKLSREDYESVAGALRAEALELLNRLEALQARGTASAERPPRD